MVTRISALNEELISSFIAYLFCNKDRFDSIAEYIQLKFLKKYISLGKYEENYELKELVDEESHNKCWPKQDRCAIVMKSGSANEGNQTKKRIWLCFDNTGLYILAEWNNQLPISGGWKKEKDGNYIWKYININGKKRYVNPTDYEGVKSIFPKILNQ